MRAQLTAFQKDVIEDASVAFAQIAAQIELFGAHVVAIDRHGEMRSVADALGGAAAYARIQGERLDKLPLMEVQP